MDTIHENPSSQPSLLLHACCGPCSLEPTRLLQEQGYSPAIFYANSNIAPFEEYVERGNTLRAWAANSGIAVTEGIYNAQEWEQSAGRIGQAALEEVLEADKLSDEEPDRAAILRIDPEKRKARCRACYRLRLQEAAAFAKQQGYQALGTTLTVSIYQYTDVIGEELERVCQETGLTPVFEDFRPYFDQAERRSKELGMYRQNYCGCRFSNLEAQAERAERRAAIKKAKQEERALHAEERAAEEAKQAAKRAEKQDYAEKQRRKRAILKAMRQQN